MTIIVKHSVSKELKKVLREFAKADLFKPFTVRSYYPVDGDYRWLGTSFSKESKMVQMDDAVLNQIKNGVEDVRQILKTYGSNAGIAICDKLLVKINAADKSDDIQK
jgi:hypothetical protein